MGSVKYSTPRIRTVHWKDGATRQDKLDLQSQLYIKGLRGVTRATGSRIWFIEPRPRTAYYDSAFPKNEHGFA